MSTTAKPKPAKLTKLAVPNGRAAVLATFGNPRGSDGTLSEAWESANLTMLTFPFPLRYEESAGRFKTVTRNRFHRLVAEPLTNALQHIWNHARLEVKRRDGFDKTTEYYDAETLEWLQQRGLDVFGGGFVYRAIRGASSLSMHAFGIAIDMAPSANALGQKTTSLPDWFIAAFEEEGFCWGGKFSGRKDPMHFQYATGC